MQPEFCARGFFNRASSSRETGVSASLEHVRKGLQSAQRVFQLLSTDLGAVSQIT